MIARTLTMFIVLAAGTARTAGAAPACSQETLSVQGAPVTIVYCITGALRANGAAEIIVPVTLTYSASRGSIGRAEELHFLSGEGVSRVLESLDLTGVGLTGTLHLTLDYSHGLVQVEGALLTPGAITIK
ncbi:MAG: hypothetical protein JO190_10930 [Candidatus Eremiobacteraeota bacterium]|nr:hypothetical protein [Candidatus Eremiobacteraeota bacterium]MBV8499213.1 hypothetical protein [Candidatus Eremiobacteraeota bacterium]